MFNQVNLSMNKLALALGAALALIVSTTANAVVITFDDLPQAIYQGLIQNGYGGLNWDNMAVLDGVNYPIENTGYTAGVVSTSNVAFNWSNEAASFFNDTAFNLSSIAVTKAWYSGITHFDGYVGNTLTYSMDVFSTTAGSTLATFNWTGLNKVTMSDGNGTRQSVIDNVTITVVPEPETYAMLLAGLGLMGFIARRRKNNAA